MLASTIMFFPILLLFQPGNCIDSKINITPRRAILNSTNYSTTKFICTKKINDDGGFEVNLAHNISLEYLRISTNLLNDTAIEITIHSYNYIGAFFLICSSNGQKSAGARSEIFIGKPPGLLHRKKRCVVYYDEYIECVIYAPVLIEAMNNRLAPNLSFDEQPLPFQPKVYREPPELIRIDNISKTLTYRWFPKDDENFPSDVKMNVIGTIYHFGTASHRMDMTPDFLISSNFTVDIVSSTDLRIVLNHGKHLTLCHGNLTRDDLIETLNLRKDVRIFDESNQTNIYVAGLRSNTPYNICFHCRRRDSLISTISELQCHRYKTLKNWSSIITIIVIIIVCCLIIFTILLVIKRREPQIQQQLPDGNANDANNRLISS